MRKYFRYLIVIVLLVSAINLIDFKEESTDKINNDEMVAIKLDDNKTNEPLLKLGKETVYDGLTRDELILRLNNNLYDTMAGTGEYFADYAIYLPGDRHGLLRRACACTCGQIGQSGTGLPQCAWHFLGRRGHIVHSRSARALAACSDGFRRLQQQRPGSQKENERSDPLRKNLSRHSRPGSARGHSSVRLPQGSAGPEDPQHGT